MNREKKLVNYQKRIMILIFGILLLGPSALGQKSSSDVYVSDPSYPAIINIDLRDLPVPRAWKPGDGIKEVPKLRLDSPITVPEPEGKIDPLLSRQFTHSLETRARAFDAPDFNFDGQGFTGVNPPDTVGDVGPNYYCQSINSGGGAVYIFYDKTDGSIAAGPFTMDALGAGVCANGLGDPIILYDWEAERWFISEFTTTSGEGLCIYISQSSDPLAGGWFAYSFINPNGFPDYPKYNVWPDGYYCTTNHGGPNTNLVFDRQAMLLGNPATFQALTTIPDLSGFGFQASTPADLDGLTPPPAGSPAYILRHRDDEVHSGTTNPSEDYIEIWEFSTDWGTPANTNLVKVQDIAVSEFDSTLCGLSSFFCFPQQGSGTTLDPLREVIMWRLVYRNFGTHETLLGNFVTDIDGNDTGGIRWFELRKTGTNPWTLYQEGTHAPNDGKSRWMAGIAMDGDGNIALGYNVSSSTSFPSLAYAGRLATDPLGTLPQAGTGGEYVIVEGSAANSSNRYGDYSSMNVDPANDCGFWFTGEYNAASSWSTRVASFTFDSCLCVALDAPTGVTATANGDNQIDVSWSAVPGAESYSVYRAQESCPATQWVLLDDGVVGTTYSDTTAEGGITYSYAVTSYDLEEDCESIKSDCDDTSTTGSCTLLPTFDGIQSVVNPQTTGCSLILDWNAGTEVCDGPLTYNVYRSTTSGFTPDGTSLIASCLTGTTYTDFDVASGVEYFYIVRSEDGTAFGTGPCSSGNEDTNTVELSGSPSGPNVSLFSDDLESGTGNWTVDANTGANTWEWMDDAPNAHSGSHVYFAPDSPTTQDHRLVTASPIDLPANKPALLSFWHKFATESGWDGGVLEYSIDAGTSWFDILDGDGGTIPSNPDRFIQGEYNRSSMSGGPLGGRSAWSGSSTTYGEVLVELDDFEGQSLLLRWRMGCDSSQAVTGWWVDDITISNGSDCDTSGCAAFSIDAVADQTMICYGETANLDVDVLGGTPAITYTWAVDPTLSATNIADPVASPTQTTTYSVQVEDSLACQGDDTITIYVINFSGAHQDQWEEWRTASQSPFNVDQNDMVDILDLCSLATACTPPAP